MAEIKKDGHLQVKEDGLRAWMWSKRYVVLREQTLTFHRNEVNMVHKAQAVTRYLCKTLKANWPMRRLDLSQGHQHRRTCRDEVAQL